MLVATFGPTTEWVGKTITFENEQFILEGHGPITASGVLQYHEQGHLVWGSDEVATWVVSRAEWEAAATAAMSTHQVQPPRSTPGPEAVDVLLPAGDVQDVVGESHYQAALEAICGGKGEEASDIEKWAHVIPEPDNPYDRNAVAVYIEGQKIGYLPRADAAPYAVLLGHIWSRYHCRGVCRARISGGWKRVHEQKSGGTWTDEGSFGVTLALAAPEHVERQVELHRLSAEEMAAGPPPY